MSHVPPLAILVTHTVADFDVWKRVFDGHQGARKAASILGHHLNTEGAQVSVYMPATDRQKVVSFLLDPDLKATMAAAGVTSPPTITWLEPIEDAHLDVACAAMIVSHEVSDFAAWKKVYDSVAGLRTKHGIIGAAVNQDLDNPNQVIVYHQAKTQQELEAFVASDELKAAMHAGGVKSAPQIRYMRSHPGVIY